MIDRIEGTKVNLRKLRRADAPILARNVNDASIARFTFIPHPYKLDDAVTFIRRSHRLWRKGTAYHFGIEDPANGEIVGCLGMESIMKKHRSTEMGYWLNRRYRGKGIISEVVAIGLRIAFGELKLVRVQAHVMPKNAASIRVLEKNGFQREGCMRKRLKHRGRWSDLYIYSILREEWKG